MSEVSISKGIYTWAYVDSDIPTSSSCHLLHFFSLPILKILAKHAAINSASGVKEDKWCSDQHRFVNTTSPNKKTKQNKKKSECPLKGSGVLSALRFCACGFVDILSLVCPAFRSEFLYKDE